MSLARYRRRRRWHQRTAASVSPMSAAAHLWQLLVAGSLVIAFFAIKWLPMGPQGAAYDPFAQATPVLALAPNPLLGL
jgi:hypothetical protein